MADAPLLQLRDDAYWVATATEIHALTHRGFSTIPVPAADRWLDRLAPHLNGEHSMADFLGSLGGEHRAFVQRLLLTLVAKGVVSERNGAEEPGTAASNQIGYFRPDPATAYADWCGSETTVIGEPTMSAHLEHALDRSGIRSIRSVGLDAGAEQWRLPQRPGGHQVVCVARLDQSDEVADCEQWCAEHELPLTQVMLGPTAAWIAPPSIRFTAAQQRLAPSEIGPADQRTDVEWTVLANYAVQAMLRAHINSAAHGIDNLARFELRSLRVSTHPYLPPPPEPPNPAPRDRLRTMLVAEPIPMEEFSRRAARLTDVYFGIFEKPREHDLTQLPLRVARTTYRAPTSSDRDRRVTVCGVGIDPAVARHMAAVEAITGYSAHLAHHERSQRLGIAAGYSLDEAITKGLLDHCKQRALGALTHARQPRPLVDIEWLTSHRVIDYCVTMLSACTSFEVYDISVDTLGVPTVAVVIDGVACAAGCGVDAAAAVADGLLRATAAWQSSTNNEPDYAPDDLVELPEHLRGSRATELTGALTRTDLMERLSRDGSSVSVELLAADPEVFQILPAVRVSVH